MFIKSTASISMAIILMISSIGLVVSVHYCHDELASISIFSEANSCCTNPNCCHNETVQVQFDKDYLIQDIQDINKQKITSIVFSLTHLDTMKEGLVIPKRKLYVESDSPPLVFDIQIQIQSFLI